MIVCPYDCHWCDLAGCRAGGCEMNGEPPLAECAMCGALVVRTLGFGLCVECVSARARVDNGGD